MRSINAPEGYEGCVFYNDGAKSWQSAFRRVGETWWTNSALVGHAHLIEAEVTARAEASIKNQIAAA